MRTKRKNVCQECRSRKLAVSDFSLEFTTEQYAMLTTIARYSVTVNRPHVHNVLSEKLHALATGRSFFLWYPPKRRSRQN